MRSSEKEGKDGSIYLSRRCVSSGFAKSGTEFQGKQKAAVEQCSTAAFNNFTYFASSSIFITASLVRTEAT